VERRRTVAAVQLVATGASGQLGFRPNAGPQDDNVVAQAAVRNDLANAVVVLRKSKCRDADRLVRPALRRRLVRDRELLVAVAGVGV
jgi:hypothetical protein